MRERTRASRLRFGAAIAGIIAIVIIIVAIVAFLL